MSSLVGDMVEEGISELEDTYISQMKKKKRPGEWGGDNTQELWDNYKRFMCNRNTTGRREFLQYLKTSIRAIMTQNFLNLMPDT